MNVSHFTPSVLYGIVPALIIQGWSEPMAMTDSEKQMAYQRRRMERIMALPEAQRDAELEKLRAVKRKASARRYERHKVKISAKAAEKGRAARRQKALDEGREFGRIGIEIAASAEEKAARQAAKREKKRVYDAARHKLLGASKRARATAWYEANEERARTRARAYYAAHPEEAKAWGRTRRARLAGASGRHTKQDIVDLFIEQDGRCFLCRETFGDGGYHVDHWVPLSRGGTNDRSNIRLLHPRCNLKKKARLPTELGVVADDRPIVEIKTNALR